jgi:quinol-cytochrome oxidoreductase complex cytochrome b subunit
MAVDYREQYRPDQLEPFWPNELFKMTVAVLCTLAVIMFFVVLPVWLDALGLHGVIHTEEPADPHGGTPVGIKPEWYFLASYQYLRIMPTEMLGISGKTLGVVTQGVAVAVVALLPFWYRKRAGERPRSAYRLLVTAAIVVSIGLTIWGGWPEAHVDGEEQLAPLSEYIGHKPMLFIVMALGLIVFYGLVAHERRTIRRTLYGPGPENHEERAP